MSRRQSMADQDRRVFQEDAAAKTHPPLYSPSDHGFTKLQLPPRTISEAVNRGVPPPRPPVSKNLSRCPTTTWESPSSKRLKRMKERIQEMSEWLKRVIAEDEYENISLYNSTPTPTPKQESEIEMDNNHPQEAVWVEKHGECLIIHFRCPCGNGYQILLSGNNCYYKLTNM